MAWRLQLDQISFVAYVGILYCNVKARRYAVVLYKARINNQQSS